MNEMKATSCLLGFALLFIAPCILGQGGSGGGKTPPPDVKKPAHKKPATRPPAVRRTVPKGSPGHATRRPAAEADGSLEIAISEPACRLYFANAAGEAVYSNDPQLTADDGSPFLAASMPSGKYHLIVRKDGFFDESRDLTIIGGKQAAVVVKLRPSVAYLTIETNVDGAEIQITGIGSFEGAARHVSVKPGTYAVNVRKDGYVSESRSITLAAAGAENNFIFDLRPQPVDELLAEADGYLKSQDYQQAVDMCKRVIELSPRDPRAYLMKANILLASGSSGAGDAFTEAISRGGEAAISVKLMGPNQLIDGELRFDRTSVQFNSPLHPDADFHLLKSEVSEITRGIDDQKNSYLSFKAEADLTGKKPKRKVVFYSSGIFLKKAGSKNTLCGGGSNRCFSDIDNLIELMTGWQRSQ